MKFIKLGVASIVALLSLQTTPSLAKPNWVEVAVNKNGDRFFVEQSTLRRNKTTAWYWVHSQYASLKSNGVVATKGYQSANCNTQQFRDRAIISFDNQAEVVNSFNDGDKGELVQPPPDSDGHMIVQYVCANQ